MRLWFTRLPIHSLPITSHCRLTSLRSGVCSDGIDTQSSHALTGDWGYASMSGRIAHAGWQCWILAASVLGGGLDAATAPKADGEEPLNGAGAIHGLKRYVAGAEFTGIAEPLCQCDAAGAGGASERFAVCPAAIPGLAVYDLCKGALAPWPPMWLSWGEEGDMHRLVVDKEEGGSRRALQQAGLGRDTWGQHAHR